jgi:hypothetical protein
MVANLKALLQEKEHLVSPLLVGPLQQHKQWQQAAAAAQAVAAAGTTEVGSCCGCVACSNM